MNERLQKINASLGTLDKMHRHGRISTAEYRVRRRHLLGTLCDSSGITARNTDAGRTVPRGNIRGPSSGSAVPDELATVPRHGSRSSWSRWLPWRH